MEYGHRVPRREPLENKKISLKIENLDKYTAFVIKSMSKIIFLLPYTF